MDYVVSGTGHRPPRLGLGYDVVARKTLGVFAKQCLEELSQARKAPAAVISGFAQGWDQALAWAALTLKIPLIAAVPFDGQETKWPQQAQQLYRLYLSKAARVEVVSPGPHANWKFHARDKWMVDNSGVVMALLDDKPEKSGTRLTVDYAKSTGRDIINVWPSWLKYVENLGR